MTARRSCAPTPSCSSRPATGAALSPSAACRPSSRAARTPRSTSAPSPRSARTRRARRATGFDGSWVAHPDLVPVCQEVFDGVLGDRPNQLDRQRDDVTSRPTTCSTSPRRRARSPEAGLRGQRRDRGALPRGVARGLGAVGIHNLMEDAATAEISARRSGSGSTTAHARRRRAPSRAELVRDVIERETARSARSSVTGTTTATSRPPSACSSRSPWPTTTWTS